MENLKKIWPEWRVVEKVGEGSFGKVYKCVRDDYGITLYSAVKVITIPQNESEINNLRLEGMSESETRTYFEGIVNDFANEIKMMVLLRNAPNIVPVENYAIVEHEGKIGWSIYIRMEYLTPFGDYVFKNKIDEAEVKKFGLDMCSALEVCAKKDIIHRDIKPDNIFIDEYGNYRLGDFGVARQLENTVGSMSKKGTYSYMAPEVYRGGKYDNRADIYSLGMVMYKLLNNNRDPFLDPHKPNLLFGDRQHALERRMNGERFSAPCNASAKMAEIILKAVEFRPEDRFANVEEFRKALNALNAPVTVDEPTVSARDFEEKTVAARDVDLTVAAPVKADYNEATVVMADEPTAIDNSNDLTAVVDYDPDATLIVEEKHREESNRKKENGETKRERIIGFCFALGVSAATILLLVIAVITAEFSKNKNQDLDNQTVENQQINKQPEKSLGSSDLSDSQVGNYITFGSYEQDNNTSNGKEPIEWLVLNKQDGKLLVVSKYALDCKPYNDCLETVVWKTCSLRSWLNNEFINSSFSSTERLKIPTVTVTADANPIYDIYPGDDTLDKVFLLSIDEVNKYFDSDIERECKATDYAIEQGAWACDSADFEANCWWWLRSPGCDLTSAALVNYYGYVYNKGISVNDFPNAVRPALWITL